MLAQGLYTLSEFVNYFEQQVYLPHADYFDYIHMNNIIKHHLNIIMIM